MRTNHRDESTLKKKKVTVSWHKILLEFPGSQRMKKNKMSYITSIICNQKHIVQFPH